MQTQRGLELIPCLFLLPDSRKDHAEVVVVDRGVGFFLDAFLEQLAHNMQAMQSLFNSLSDETRQELQRLMQQVFGDAQLQQAMAELAHGNGRL